MDKEKVKAMLNEVVAKAKAAMLEIKDNFKADEDATGARKIQSRFVNLWKSGITGRAAMIASSVVVLLLLVSVFCGGGGSDTGTSAPVAKSAGPSEAPVKASSTGMPVVTKPAPSVPPVAKSPAHGDTLIVKGLYMRMPVNDALAACKRLVASSKDLVVVDFRNGIAVEREIGKEKYIDKMAEAYDEHMFKRNQVRVQYSEEELEKMGLKWYTYEEWKVHYRETHPPTEEDNKKITEFVSKKNLIQISVKKDQTREDALPGLAFVWIDNAGKVKEVYFNEDGMSRFFNAGDLSGEEFAQALVTNYSGIPSLKREAIHVARQIGTHPVSIRTTTFIHRDPRGYQVKCFEREFIDDTGKVYNSKMVQNGRVGGYLLDDDSMPEKFFAITAIKPGSSLKFD